MNLVRTVLCAALESGELEWLPERRRLANASRKPLDTFTDDELAMIALQATGWPATAIQLSVQAGLSKGEVLTLLLGAIDFDQENLLVKRACPEARCPAPKARSRSDPPCLEAGKRSEAATPLDSVVESSTNGSEGAGGGLRRRARAGPAA